MKKILVLQFFKFAHAGIHVEEFNPGPDPVETTDECADLAVIEGWAEFEQTKVPTAPKVPTPRKPAAPKTKVIPQAPENKAESALAGSADADAGVGASAGQAAGGTDGQASQGDEPVTPGDAAAAQSSEGEPLKTDIADPATQPTT